MTTPQKKCGYCREIGHNITTCSEMEKNKECSICLSQISKIKNSIITPCKHHFCFNCFMKWNYEHNTCPVCRRRVSPIRREHYVYVENEVERIVEVPIPPFPYYKNKLIDIYNTHKSTFNTFIRFSMVSLTVVLMKNIFKGYYKVDDEIDNQIEAHELNFNLNLEM